MKHKQLTVPLAGGDSGFFTGVGLASGSGLSSILDFGSGLGSATGVALGSSGLGAGATGATGAASCGTSSYNTYFGISTFVVFQKS